MSFGSDPGRDDGGPSPANIVIPDDARELARDVLAYRREQRARRRQERVARLLRPLRRLGGYGAIVPMIATCAALSMVAGVLLSVLAIGPASAPTLATYGLPSGTFTVNGASRPVRGLRSTALALIPPGCACDQVLRQLSADAHTARAGLYFVGEGRAIPQIQALTTRDGHGVAAAAADPGNVLAAAYRPSGLTVVLIYSDGTAQVSRGISMDFPIQLSALRALAHPGR